MSESCIFDPGASRARKLLAEKRLKEQPDELSLLCICRVIKPGSINRLSPVLKHTKRPGCCNGTNSKSGHLPLIPVSNLRLEDSFVSAQQQILKDKHFTIPQNLSCSIGPGRTCEPPFKMRNNIINESGNFIPSTYYKVTRLYESNRSYYMNGSLPENQGIKTAFSVHGRFLGKISLFNLFVPNHKGFRKAQEFIILGEQLYNDEAYEFALSSLTQSIGTALENSFELSLAYARKAEVLYTLGWSQSFLDNTDISFASRVPKSMCLYLMEKKACTLFELRKDVSTIVQEGLKYLNENYKKTDPYFEIHLAFWNAIRIIKRSRSPRKKDIQIGDKKAPIEFPAGPHKDIPEFSAAIDVKHNSQFGRHIVATQKIEPGDVIAVEDPIARVLDTYNVLYNHCHFCLKRSYSLIPCTSCTLTFYCSTECCESAFTRYHATECPIIYYIRCQFANEMPVALLLRYLIEQTEQGKTLLTFRKEWMEIRNTKPISCNPFDTHLRNESETPRKSQLRSILNAKKIMLPEVVDLWTYLVKDLSRMLRLHTNFMKGSDTETDASLQEFIVEFLFVMLKRMHRNIFCIQEVITHKPLRRDDNVNYFDLEEFESVISTSVVGESYYPNCTYFNHSCLFNALWTFADHTKMVLTAVRTIQPNEQVFITYDIPFYFNEYARRCSTFAESYKFRCKCLACKNEWDMFRTSEMLVDMFDKCKDSHQSSTEINTCPNCQIVLTGKDKFLRSGDLYRIAEEMFTKQRFNDELLKQCLWLMKEYETLEIIEREKYKEFVLIATMLYYQVAGQSNHFRGYKID